MTNLLIISGLLFTFLTGIIGAGYSLYNIGYDRALVACTADYQRQIDEMEKEVEHKKRLLDEQNKKDTEKLRAYSWQHRDWIEYTNDKITDDMGSRTCFTEQEWRDQLGYEDKL